jgi:RNA polymerase sigma factor (TIGR02999 family)
MLAWPRGLNCHFTSEWLEQFPALLATWSIVRAVQFTQSAARTEPPRRRAGNRTHILHCAPPNSKSARISCCKTHVLRHAQQRTSRLPKSDCELHFKSVHVPSDEDIIPVIQSSFLMSFDGQLMGDVTLLLEKIESGDPDSTSKLLPLVYDELHRLATSKMLHESPDHTLQATALVHEAYLRLSDARQAQHWDSRGHFFAAAAEAMRRILVESARRKQRLKHGGNCVRIHMDESSLPEKSRTDDLLALDEALDRLEEHDPNKAKLVKLRYFAGFSVEESAELLGISRATASRQWAYARAWLFAEINDAATCDA